MRYVRFSLVALTLVSALTVVAGCNNEEPGKVTGPVDTSGAAKSSEEAYKAQMQNTQIPTTPKKP